jgi:hypothetical protein
MNSLSVRRKGHPPSGFEFPASTKLDETLEATNTTLSRLQSLRVSLPLSSNSKSRIGECATSLTDSYIGMGLARNELMTPSVKRVGLRSPILLATDVAMGASRSATFNRFKTSSKATVIAAVSSGPNAVLIAKSGIGILLTYRCESEKLPDCQ